MRAFIEANFKMMDVNADGVIGLEEFRYNCIQRIATDDIKIVDEAFNNLLNVSFIVFIKCCKREAFIPRQGVSMSLPLLIMSRK